MERALDGVRSEEGKEMWKRKGGERVIPDFEDLPPGKKQEKQKTENYSHPCPLAY